VLELSDVSRSEQIVKEDAQQRYSSLLRTGQTARPGSNTRGLNCEGQRSFAAGINAPRKA
jgi:hypothetical protein